jgi:MFS transporter, ACS family, D-galactonate transporter
VVASESADAKPGPGRARVAVLLFFCVVINYLDRSNLSIVAPRLGDDLRLEPRQLGLALSAFGWTYAIFQVPASRLIDRISPRYLLALTLFLWSLATVCNGFVQSFVTLIVLRMIVGALEAPSYPINNRVVTSWFPQTERAGVIGLYTSGQFVGLAFLTPILTLLETRYGWRAVFQITGIVGIAWSVIWWLLYRDPEHDQNFMPKKSKYVDNSESFRELSGERKTALAHDLALVLGDRRLWGIYLGQFGLNSTLWFFLTWFPTYLTRYRHLKLDQAGILGSVPFLAAFFGVLSGGVISDLLLRRGASLTLARKLPIVFGLMLASLIGFAGHFTDIRLVIGCMSISFFGCGFASITWSLVSALAPPNLIGLTGGFFNFFSNCSAIVVPILVGWLIHGDDFSRPLLFISSMALMGIFSYVVLVGTIPEHPTKIVS